jgi:hypothetical protein
MNHRDDLDRTLEAWFRADAPTTAPRQVLETVVTETGRRAPRPAWLAGLRGDGMGTPALVFGRPARPLVLLAILGALLVGLIGGAILASGGRPALSVLFPTPTPRPTRAGEPEPTVFLSGGVMPVVDVPAGLNPKTTAASWELHVLALLRENVRELGWEEGAPKVTAIRLLAPGTTHETTWVDGLDHGGTGFTAERLSWAIDAEGTMLSCGTKCAVFRAGTFFFDDVSEALVATGATADAMTTAIPSATYRHIVEDAGRAFRPEVDLPQGSLDLNAILDLMRARGWLPAGTTIDPIYGTDICSEMTECGPWGSVEAGQDEHIWWIGLPDVVLPPDSIGAPGPGWVTFDAQTGEALLSALP